MLNGDWLTMFMGPNFLRLDWGQAEHYGHSGQVVVVQCEIHQEFLSTSILFPSRKALFFDPKTSKRPNVNRAFVYLSLYISLIVSYSYPVKNLATSERERSAHLFVKNRS